MSPPLHPPERPFYTETRDPGFGGRGDEDVKYAGYKKQKLYDDTCSAEFILEVNRGHWITMLIAHGSALYEVEIKCQPREIVALLAFIHALRSEGIRTRIRSTNQSTAQQYYGRMFIYVQYILYV